MHHSTKNSPYSPVACLNNAGIIKKPLHDINHPKASSWFFGVGDET